MNEMPESVWITADSGTGEPRSATSGRSAAMASAPAGTLSATKNHGLRTGAVNRLKPRTLARATGRDSS